MAIKPIKFLRITHLPPPDSDAPQYHESYRRLPSAHDFYLGGHLAQPGPYRPTHPSPEPNDFFPLESTAGAHAHQYGTPQVDVSASMLWPAWTPSSYENATATAGPSVAQNRPPAATAYPASLSPPTLLDMSPPASPFPSGSTGSSIDASRDAWYEACSCVGDYGAQSARQPCGQPLVKPEVATPAMRGAADRRRKRPHRFFCWCGAGFTARHNLQAHERSHSGQKGFGCDRCGLAFDNPGVLKRHRDKCLGLAIR
ncbi:hypothetical protein HDZ31DRAFT_85285 [Schizophyllum fasciatum]